MSSLSPEPGWYPDPANPAQQRYWDGSNWSEETAPNYVTTELGPNGSPYASFWARFGGLIVDSIIFAFVATIIFLPIYFAFIAPNLSENLDKAIGAGSEVPLDGELFGLSFLLGVVVFQALYYLYYIVGIAKYGRTIGGKAMAIRCVNENGVNPTWKESVIRAGVPAGLSVLSYLPIIGIISNIVLFVNYLWMLWDPKKQCLMDKAAKTYVVKA